MDFAVLGNVALDVICKTVDDVPRYSSIGFEQAAITAGGCGSNVALGLCALNVPTGIIARIGDDEPAEMIIRQWDRAGLDQRFVKHMSGYPTGVSIGLVDSQAQPRFVHTPGASAFLNAGDVDLDALASLGVYGLHVAGYFVLPGLLDERFSRCLADAQQNYLFTSLDVVESPAMLNPSPLWPCLPHLNLFLCNRLEAELMTGEAEPDRAAEKLAGRGAQAVIIKLGAEGCWVQQGETGHRVEGRRDVPVVDTTGAGDAFAAGLLAALRRGEDLVSACQAGSAAGARAVGALGALAGWGKYSPQKGVRLES